MSMPPALAQAGRPEMGHVKLTLSSSLLDARNEELATGHRVYWPIKVPTSAKRDGRAEHKGNVALRFKYFDGTRELPKGGSLRNEAAHPASPAPPSASAQAAASPSASLSPSPAALLARTIRVPQLASYHKPCPAPAPAQAPGPHQARRCGSRTTRAHTSQRATVRRSRRRRWPSASAPTRRRLRWRTNRVACSPRPAVAAAAVAAVVVVVAAAAAAAVAAA